MPNPQTRGPVAAANAEKSVLFTNRTRVAFDDRDARMRMSVGQNEPDEHVLQIGAPNGPELGILAKTNGSLTLDASDVFTSVCASDNSFTDERLSLASGSSRRAAELAVKAQRYGDSALSDGAALVGAAHTRFLDQSLPFAARVRARLEERRLVRQLRASLADGPTPERAAGATPRVPNHGHFRCPRRF